MSISATFADTCALVLAAGKGTGVRSPLPKVLVPLQGRPFALHLLDALVAAGPLPCKVAWAQKRVEGCHG